MRSRSIPAPISKDFIYSEVAASVASSSSTAVKKRKFRVKSQTHKKKAVTRNRHPPPLDRDRRHHSTSPPQHIGEDSPMTDFMDVKLAKVTKQEYIRQLQRFFDFLQLDGDLDKQSRAFLTQVRKNHVWVQD